MQTTNTNHNYRNGRAKEYRLKYKYEKKGYIVLRTAQSRGFADLIAIDNQGKTIIFIQSKPRNYSKKAKQRLKQEFGWLNNKFVCAFEVL